MARRDPNGAVFYFFDDHLGNTRVTTNATGGVVDDMDPYPHGGFRVISYTSGDRYLFTDHEYDPESYTHYMRARQYSIAGGRFLQPDEFTGGPVDAFSANDPLPPGPLPYADITNPQSLNKYAYVYNNPLNLVDPNGHDALGLLQGFANALLSNAGAVDRVSSDDRDVQLGQAVGDATSVVLGAAEMVGGAAIAGAGAAEAVLTAPAAGTGVGVVVPAAGVAVATAGAVVATHGATFAASGATHLAKDTPNPFGSKGAPDHQQTAKEEAAKIGGRTEVTVSTPGGEKVSRRIDAAVQNPRTGNVSRPVQVYRPTNTGKIPAREVRAARDIQNATGKKPKMVPVRPGEK